MVKVTHDGEPSWGVRERCCVCRKPTNFWYTPKDVALCCDCADIIEAEDIPSKAEWLAKERELAHKRIGY